MNHYAVQATIVVRAETPKDAIETLKTVVAESPRHADGCELQDVDTVHSVRLYDEVVR